MDEIDPDNRGVDEDESDWKDFYEWKSVQ
jgi:hypothetical protein